jgi:hypothetical protein
LTLEAENDIPHKIHIHLIINNKSQINILLKVGDIALYHQPNTSEV